MLPLACDFGKGWELVKVGSAAFGEFYRVHAEGGRWSCSCPGGTYRDVCKHARSLAALLAAGQV